MATPVSSLPMTPARGIWWPGLGLATCCQAEPFQCRVIVWVPSWVRSAQPTAHALPGDVSLTAVRVVSGPGLGVGTWVQLVPSQCSASDCSTWFRSTRPTIQASDADAALTASRSENIPETVMGTRVQLVPSQCSITAGRLRSLLSGPAVQASVAESALTPNRTPLSGAGPGTWVQLVPSQCRMMILPVLRLQPAAQPSAADTMFTPFSSPKGIFGLFALDQLMPFQCMIRGTAPGWPAMTVKPTAHASDGDTALTAFSCPVMLVTAPGLGAGGAAAASVPISTTLPTTAGRNSRRPRRRIEPTACALVITDLPISRISGANPNPEALGTPQAPTRMGFSSPECPVTSPVCPARW